MVAVLRLPVQRPEGIAPETIAAASRGDRSAQSLFVEHFSRPVWALVCRILGRAGRRSIAEDTTQDALLAALRALPRARSFEPRAVSGFVLTVAARTAVDALRRQRTIVPVDEGTVRECDRPDRALEQRDVGRLVEDALELLAPEIRAAFVLRAFHELEYAEIADALAIDIGTVKSRLWRARTALKKMLAEVAP